MSLTYDSLAEEVTNHPTIDEVFSLLPNEQRKNIFPLDTASATSTTDSASSSQVQPPRGDVCLFLLYQDRKIKISNQRIGIGRVATADLRINDNQVSTRHCYVEDGNLVDTNSTNGTFVNTTKIEPDKPYKLQLGDVIQLGSSELRVVSDDSKDAKDSKSPSSSTDASGFPHAKSDTNGALEVSNRFNNAPFSFSGGAGNRFPMGQMKSPGVLSPDQVLNRIPRPSNHASSSFNSNSLSNGGSGNLDNETRLHLLLSTDEILALEDPRTVINYMREDLMQTRRREHVLRKKSSDVPKEMMESYNKLQNENDALKTTILYGADMTVSEVLSLKYEGKSQEADQILKIATYKAEIKDLQREFTTLCEKQETTETALTSAKKEIEDLKAQLASKDTQEETSKIDTEHDSLALQKDQRISELEAELQKLKESLATATASSTKSEETAAHELESSKKELDEITSKLRESTAQKQAIEELNSQLQTDLSMEQQKVVDALASAKKSQEAEQEAITTLDKLKEQIQSNKSQPEPEPKTQPEPQTIETKRKTGTPNAVASLRNGLDKLFVALAVESGVEFSHREELQQAMLNDDTEILVSFIQSEKYIQLVYDVSRYISSTKEMKKTLDKNGTRSPDASSIPCPPNSIDNSRTLSLTSSNSQLFAVAAIPSIIVGSIAYFLGSTFK